MANTQVHADNVVTRWLSEFFREYIRNNRFSRYTGTGVNNVIVVKEGRKKISIPLVTRLKGDGVTGSQTLRGNGEAIGNYAWELTPTYFRHAVEFDREELEKPAIDLMRAARPLLMDWAMELTRDQIIQAFAAVYDGTTYASFGDASEAVKDAWSVNNSDRILYGAVKSNHSGDVSADLAKVDVTDDKLDTGIIGLAKRMAQTADPHVRPLRTREDEEFFVLFAGTRAFRDLKADPVMTQANREARDRGVNNPLFRGGDLLWDNVIIREIPEITTLLTESAALSTAGASSAPVEPCFLCGAQALGFGMGQRPRTIVDRDFDYGFQPGVAGELKHHIQKLFYNNVQHGLVTVFVNGTADS